MNAAPVARATARLAIASHRMFDAERDAGSRPGAPRSAPPSPPGSRARPGAGRAGRPRCRTGARRRRPPGGPRGRGRRRRRPRPVPPPTSWRGRPGRPGRWSIAMTGFVVPKIRSSASIAPSSARFGASAGASAHVGVSATTIVHAERGQRLELVAAARRVGDERADRGRLGDDGVGARCADLRSVGDHDQPGRHARSPSRWISAVSSSSSVSPQRAESPAAPSTARSNR